ncbi:MAG: B12-binding domain-containing radical SAM protein [Deltaproteobacteria bacterium]|nr:B12-binding domain-containing radical SAM protein [Deltaproteobacteria bacterium]MBW2066793.1 B12-binding domain-containing radical SAM protein [Deltaproteobacteria bacterium]
MKILLVYPEYPDTFWSFKHALKFIRKKAAYPPLGLLTVAALLPSHWDKRLVDANTKGLTDKDLEWADMVFIGAMAVQRDSAIEIISRCKGFGLPVVAGGPLFTSEYDQFEEVDHFVLNEAELTLPPFLRDLEQGSPRRIYQTPQFADIKETPIPMWELADMKSYASMCVQFSRGCPFHCEFCNVTALFGHRPRLKTSEQVINELEHLNRMGWRGQVFFVDDNFICNKRYLKTKLLPALIEWQKGRKGLPLHTEASINLADDQQLMDLMVEAGFDAVFIGIETPDEGSLEECNKKQNKNRDLVESIRKIQRAGLQVQGGFIVGFDNDSPSIFKRQIEFIQRSGIVTAMVGLLQAPAGTRLFDRLKKEGRLLGSMSGNTDGTTNIVPRMDIHTLREGYRDILNKIYSPQYYYNRVKAFLREYKAPKFKTPLDFQHLLAFFRTSIRLGVFGRERFQYWKILLWTLLHRPRLLAWSVTFAIYGHHFRKISEKYTEKGENNEYLCGQASFQRY